MRAPALEHSMNSLLGARHSSGAIVFGVDKDDDPNLPGRDLFVVQLAPK
jgi:hypothetical protein